MSITVAPANDNPSVPQCMILSFKLLVLVILYAIVVDRNTPFCTSTNEIQHGVEPAFCFVGLHSKRAFCNFHVVTGKFFFSSFKGFGKHISYFGVTGAPGLDFW